MGRLMRDPALLMLGAICVIEARRIVLLRRTLSTLILEAEHVELLAAER